MKVILKKAFSIIDGRLSTKIDDVYEMLNYVFDASFMTHQLPCAMNKLTELNPDWYKQAVSTLEAYKSKHNTNNFDELMKLLENDNNEIELGNLSFW